MAAPEALLPSALRNRTSYVLAKLTTLARRQSAGQVAAWGLNQHQHAILCCLDEFGPACQKDIAARLGVDVGDTVSFVDGLQRAGLISRERDERDRRRQILTLTAAGRRVLGEIEDRLDAAEPGALAALTAAERAALHDYAVRVLAAAMPGAWSADEA